MNLLIGECIKQKLDASKVDSYPTKHNFIAYNYWRANARTPVILG